MTELRKCYVCGMDTDLGSRDVREAHSKKFAFHRPASAWRWYCDEHRKPSRTLRYGDVQRYYLTRDEAW
jgi:hypothetical protein